MDLSFAECEKMRDEGLIRAIGVSVKGPDVTQATQDLARVYIKDGRVDVMMMVYSIFRQMNCPVFKEAYDRNIGIVARTSLESGFLTGAIPAGTRFPEIDHRSRWNDRVDFIAETVDKLREEAVKPPYQGINEVAIRFSAAGEGITSLVIGALTVEHLEATLQATTRPPLDADTLAMLQEKYKDYTDLCNSGEGTKIFLRPDGIK
jgi:aryl-alcohol dehydrogenase-like predicted oxidoreductase